MIQQVTSSPALVRAVPFAVFLGLTFLQDMTGEAGRYWLYCGKTIAGAAMLVVVWRHIEEIEWRFSWEAVVVGIAVFVMWVGLDPLTINLGLGEYPKSKITGQPWNPHQFFGEGALLAWFFVVVRIAGSTLVVPPLEEVFYRSFLYRYLWNTNFLNVPLGKYIPVSLVLTSTIFAATHREWLAAFLCGLAYQGLVIWKKRLGDAITAHAITNLLLGLWIVWRGAWKFW